MADRAANPRLVINTLLRRIRFYLDEPVDDKYNDNDLLELVVPSALQEVWGYLHATSDNPIIASFTITLASGTKEYQLPPSVQNVWNILQLDSNGDIIGELTPRGKHHRRGPNWYIEGGNIRFDPDPVVTGDYVVRYTPVPDQLMHYATDGYMYSDLQTIQLSPSPSAGWVDLRDNAYIGCTIRMLGSQVIETRMIDSYDPYGTPPNDASESSQSSDAPEGPIITVRTPFTRNTTRGPVTYEIFPPGSASFIEAVALGAVLKLATARSVSQARIQAFMAMYRNSRKAEVQRLENLMGRRGKHIEKVTTDNPDLGLHNLFTSWWTP